MGGVVNKSGALLLRVLDSFTLSPRNASLSEIAAAVDVPKPTLHRVLTTLVGSGYIMQDQVSRRYALGPKVLTLSTAYIDRQDILQTARPFLEELVETTGETVTLAVRSEREVVFVDKVDGTRRIRFFCQIGQRLALHTGAAAKSILFASLDDEVAEYLSASSLNGHPWFDESQRNALLTDCKASRSRGYTYSNEEVDEGVSAVGAPVRNHMGEVVAGIGLASLSSHIAGEKVDYYGGLIQATAKQVSARMGFRQ